MNGKTGTYQTSREEYAVLDNLSDAILLADEEGHIVYGNLAAESFFQAPLSLTDHCLGELLKEDSSLLSLIEQAHRRKMPAKAYDISLHLPRIGLSRLVDIQVSPMLLQQDSGLMIIHLHERGVAGRISHHNHKGTSRSLSGLGALLAHEIKNPLSGIRGAAQLLEACGEDHSLTSLISDETDRILRLIEHMESFSDGQPADREVVNIHAILEHVKRLAQSGFGKTVHFSESYDPSLPEVLGNRDQLVQLFLNLVKNASEALGSRMGGEIRLTSAYRSGVHMRADNRHTVSLPLEVQVMDNGPGIAEEIREYMFDAFVSTRQTGSGLGLVMVAKIVEEHGGMVAYERQGGWTIFRILLPVHKITQKGA